MSTLQSIAALLFFCSAAVAQTSQPATQPATRQTKQLYFDVGFHVPTWRARLPPGFLPAIVEGGGRYVGADGKENSYLVGGYYGPGEEFVPGKLRFAAAQLPPGALYVYDQERPSWSTDIRRVTPKIAEANKQRLRSFAAMVREGNPAVRVAFYAWLPRDDYWVTTRAFAARKVFEKWKSGVALSDEEKWSISHAYTWTGTDYVLDDSIAGSEGRAAFLRWQAANTNDTFTLRADGSVDESAGIEDSVDALTPSLYDFYLGDDGEGFVYETIAEARRIANGRPVYPFVWPVYHNSNPTDGGKTIPLDEWRAHVRRVLRQADGCVLWGADPVKHREHIRVLMEEAELASRQPAS